MMNAPSHFLILGSILIFGLTGCQTAPQSSQSAQLSKIDSVLQRAATDAASKGKAEESLELLQAMYKRNSEDPILAVRYASALRHAEQYDKASLVLSGFITGDNVNSMALTEYAALQAAQGDYILAESYAEKALKLSPNHARAHHIRGIAFDAQGHHAPAELEFRTALDNWLGDPIPVLNNLGLNLAAQGKIDEAIEVLNQASIAAPDRIEVERNLRIVSALGNRGGVYGDYYKKDAPKPMEKPRS